MADISTIDINEIVSYIKKYQPDFVSHNNGKQCVYPRISNRVYYQTVLSARLKIKEFEEIPMEAVTELDRQIFDILIDLKIIELVENVGYCLID